MNLMPETELLTAELHTRLAQALPDIPRYVETRAMLIANQCEVFGLDASHPQSFVARHLETGLISVIGSPPVEAIRQAVEADIDEDTVLAFDDNFELVREALPGWRFERATLHLLGEASYLPEATEGSVRFLTSVEVEALSGVPEDLKEELILEATHTEIAATFADGKPVAFCYAGSVTETLWDISIDTLEGYRHRGFAGQCVAFLIDHFACRGKRPVWGAVESNAASRKLAAKLGFVPVDELFVFEPS